MAEIHYNGVSFGGLLLVALIVLAILGYVSWNTILWIFCYIPLIILGIVGFCFLLWWAVRGVK